MTAFTVCWLPFFILAVLRPFSASVMQIPRYVTSIALWLGYVNSVSVKKKNFSFLFCPNKNITPENHNLHIHHLLT